MSDYSWPPSEDDLVRLANDLLERLHVSGRIKHWTEINSDVFVTLLEGLWGEPLPDAIRHPRCREDEIHNCQSVMDTLSLDLLNTSLSHISSHDIVNKNRAAISNLLDVFSGLFEYMVDKISSDISEEDGSDVSDVDPDLVTPEFIDSILEKELKRTHNTSTISKSPTQNSLASQSAGSQRWMRSSPGYCHGETSDALKMPDSGNHRKHSTVSGNLPKYRSGYGDLYSTESRKSNLTDSTNSRSQLTANQMSHLALSIDQASKGLHIDDGSTPEDTLMSHSKTAPDSVRASSSNKSLSDLRTTAVSLPPQPPAKAVTSSTSPIQPTLSADTPNLSGHILGMDKQRGPFDNLGVRKPRNMADLSNSLPVTEQSLTEQAIHHKHTHYLYHYVGKDDSKSSSRLSGAHKSEHRGRLASSLPLSRSVSHKEGQRKTNSYENLQNLVRDTVEISRAAISSGPVNNKIAASTHDTTPKKSAGASSFRSSVGGVQTSSSNKPSADVISNRLRQTNANSPGEVDLVTSHKYSPKKNVSFANDPTASRPQGLQAKQEMNSGKEHGGTTTSRPVLAERGSSASRVNDTPISTDKPKTVKEYLMKYYGRERIRSYSDGDINSDSDEQEYGSTGPLIYKPALYEKKLRERAKKMVKFDDLLDDLSPGRFGNLRSKINKEGERSRLRTAYIDKMYEEDLNDHEDEVYDRLKEAKKKAEQVEKQYKNTLKGRNKKIHTKGKHKSPISVLNKKNRSRSGLVHGRRRSLSCSPSIGRRNVTISGSDIMPWLLEEFPYIHISPQTLHHMWNKSAHQIEQLSQVERGVKCKKSKAEVQIEEAEIKQKILSNIMKKELKHNERLNEIKERRRQVQSVKAKIRERRLQSARCRKYYEEYHVRNRSRMLKKKSKEELIFRRLFEDALNIQKERIRELRKYARDQRNQKARKQQDHLESLENYYKDQYNMLMETLAHEREELDVRERAQTKVLNSLKRELQKKMEREIREFQEQLYRDEDEAYFRQIDADRIRHQLNLARYQAKI